MADSTAEEARKARARARAQNSWRGSTGSTDRLVMDLTRGKAGLLDKIGGRYVNKAEQRAANIMQKRRENDTAKTARRATAIEKREVKKTAAKTLMTGVSGGMKKAAPKPKPKTKTKPNTKTKPKKPSTKKK
jgi:hypothetical protein